MKKVVLGLCVLGLTITNFSCTASAEDNWVFGNKISTPSYGYSNYTNVNYNYMPSRDYNNQNIVIPNIIREHMQYDRNKETKELPVKGKRKFMC